MGATETEKLPETDQEEDNEMWFDNGDGILRELMPAYDLTDGSTVYVKTSRYRMYDDDDVAGD